jgi:hypothetical protein
MKKIKTSLKLTKTTVRVLQAAELAAVGGGVANPSDNPLGCARRVVNPSDNPLGCLHGRANPSDNPLGCVANGY